MNMQAEDYTPTRTPTKKRRHEVDAEESPSFTTPTRRMIWRRLTPLSSRRIVTPDRWSSLEHPSFPFTPNPAPPSPGFSDSPPSSPQSMLYMELEMPLSPITFDSTELCLRNDNDFSNISLHFASTPELFDDFQKSVITIGKEWNDMLDEEQAYADAQIAATRAAVLKLLLILIQLSSSPGTWGLFYIHLQAISDAIPLWSENGIALNGDTWEVLQCYDSLVDSAVRLLNNDFYDCLGDWFGQFWRTVFVKPNNLI